MSTLNSICRRSMVVLVVMLMLGSLVATGVSASTASTTQDVAGVPVVPSIQDYSNSNDRAEGIKIETTLDEVRRGETIEYTVTGGLDGDYHLVAISSDDFRDRIQDAGQVFRDTEDTVATGFVDYNRNTSTVVGQKAVNATNAAAAFAIVKMDGTQASGEIDTKLLDDSSVTVQVFTASGTGGYYTPARNNISLLDDADFDVLEGSVSITSLADEYQIGSEITISGDAPAADEVRIYARDTDNWQPIKINGQYTVSVDPNGAFQENIAASEDSPGNSMLSTPGAYDIGVVINADLFSGTTLGNGLSGAIAHSEFIALTGERQQINAVTGNITLSVETYDGGVAEGDASEVEVSGLASGQDGVVVVFIDDQGGVISRSVDVSDGTIDSDDFDIRGLNKGQVTVYAISAGGDDIFGDGTELPSGGVRSAETIASYISEGDGDEKQIRERLLSITSEDGGSDDAVTVVDLIYTDGRVSVDGSEASIKSTRNEVIVEPGQPITVDVTTNRNPRNAMIRAELLDQNRTEAHTVTVDEWEATGSSLVTLSTENLDPGNYFVDVSVGDSSDSLSVTIETMTNDTVESVVENGTPEASSVIDPGYGGNSTSGGNNSGDIVDVNSNDQSSSSRTGPVDGETNGSIPGFTVLTFVASMLIIALGVRAYKD